MLTLFLVCATLCSEAVAPTADHGVVHAVSELAEAMKIVIRRLNSGSVHRVFRLPYTETPPRYYWPGVQPFRLRKGPER